MQIIETCPVCGADLELLTLTMNPPIPARRCRKCGWYWQGKQEQTIRVPFKAPPTEKEQEAERAYERLLERFAPKEET